MVISTNVPLRQDGLPYASAGAVNVADPGAAVYFSVEEKRYVLACDKWDKVKDNLRAIAKHIEALRGIDRWGVTSVEEAFSPFLLPSEQRGWWTVLGVSKNATKDQVKQAFKQLSLKFHPDRETGDRAKWDEINNAYEQAMNDLQ